MGLCSVVYLKVMFYLVNLSSVHLVWEMIAADTYVATEATHQPCFLTCAGACNVILHGISALFL